MHKHKLAQLIASSLQLSAESAQQLVHFDNPSFQPANGPCGDFYAVLEKVVCRFCKLESKLTIFEVNEYLDAFAGAQKEQRVILMSRLVNSCQVNEFGWFCRMLLKDLQLNLPLQKILKCFHAQANEYFNLNLDLKKMCLELSSREFVLSQQISVFTAVKPMLAGRRSFQQIKQHFAQVPFLIETKHDGERIQAHIQTQPPQVRYFSRRGGDVSERYMSLSAFLLASVQSAVVFDGEMLSLDERLAPLPATSLHAAQHLCYVGTV